MKHRKMNRVGKRDMQPTVDIRQIKILSLTTQDFLIMG